MKEQFKNYLIMQGYSEYTAKGTPSTVYDYIKRIDFVCKQEGMTWIQLAHNISSIVHDYDVGGSKEIMGAVSHRAVINALKRFEEFVGEN